MKLAALFGDHAVLQRDMPIPIWGWISPRRKVAITLGPVRAESLSGSDGKFLVRLPSMPAGGPYRLEAIDLVTGDRAGAEDIYIGEVWLASGQSNMEFTFRMLGCCRKEFSHISTPMLRMYSMPHLALAGKQQECDAEWIIAENEAILDFSAVAYHFADRLHRELDIAVGIICNAWGGTQIEAWISRETLLRNEYFCDLVHKVDMMTSDPVYWKPYRHLSLYDPGERVSHRLSPKLISDEGNNGLSQGYAELNFNDNKWNTMVLPGSWKQRGVVFNGALWFRKKVNIPDGWLNKDLCLELGAIDKHDESYFNGVKTGGMGHGIETQYWNVTRKYQISSTILRHGENAIAVRVYSFADNGGLIGPAHAMMLYPKESPEQAIALSGEWKFFVEKNIGNVLSPSLEPGPGNPNTPHILFDNLVNPVIPYAVRGIIWYQGEANATSKEKYFRMMTDLIRDWRFFWGQGDFPFLIVQLANFCKPKDFQPDSEWAFIREAQLNSLSEPNTGLAVTIDIGEADNVHPRNKADVGERLALWALADTYGKPIIKSGPLYKSHIINRDSIRIDFECFGSELVCHGKELLGFVIAGDEKVFVPAQADIKGSSVIVRADGVDFPQAVRYAWADNPSSANLYNNAGLPASPFRTDRW